MGRKKAFAEKQAFVLPSCVKMVGARVHNNCAVSRVMFKEVEKRELALASELMLSFSQGRRNRELKVKRLSPW